jgi:hypothetical protein
MKKILLLKFLFLFVTLTLRAEGTKQLGAADGDGYPMMLMVYKDAASQFAVKGGPETERLYVTVKEGETINFGFASFSGNALVRLMGPNGKPVLMDTVLERSVSTTRGYISGLNMLSVPVGQKGSYIPNSFLAEVAGNYYFEFTPATTKLGTYTTFALKYFDVTVTDKESIVQNGRLWSKSWNFYNEKDYKIFGYPFWIQSADNYVTRVQGAEAMMDLTKVFRLQANATGLTSTGNVEADRASARGVFDVPQYPIYINEPAHLAFIDEPLTSFLGSVSISGCEKSYDIVVKAKHKGFAEIILDLDGKAGYTSAADLRFVKFIDPAVTNSVRWDGYDGRGNLFPPGKEINCIVRYYNGLVNLPSTFLNNRKGFDIKSYYNSKSLTSTYSNWDDSDIGGNTGAGCKDACHLWAGEAGLTYNTWWYLNLEENSAVLTIPYLNAGGEAVICNTGVLNLSPVYAGIPSIQWTSTGTGTFKDPTFPGTYYIPSEEDIRRGSVVLTIGPGSGCSTPPSSLNLTIRQAPVVFAGKDAFDCKTALPQVQSYNLKLSGTVNPLETVKWMTDGKGTINNLMEPATDYFVSQEDYDRGYINFALTTIGTPACPMVSDTVRVTFEDYPIAEAGTGFPSCFNNIQLKGAATAAKSVRWIGNGIFSAANTLITGYTPTAAELSSGTATVKLVAFNNSCPSDTDEVVIAVKKPVAVNLGPDRNICVSKDTIIIKTPAVTLNWGKSGTGSIDYVANSVSAKYTISAEDRKLPYIWVWAENKTVTGDCPAVRDSIKITFAPLPVVKAGDDQYLCEGKQATLSVVTENSTDLTWSVDPAAGTLQTKDKFTSVFTPGTVRNNLVKINATAKSLYCAAVTDMVQLYYYESPRVQLGNDFTVCSDSMAILVNATVSGAQSLNWSSTGYGPITGGPASALYNASENDTIRPVKITATAASLNQYCTAVSDSLLITVVPYARPYAGEDITACGASSIQLDGKILNAQGTAIWNTNGKGNIIPSQLVQAYPVKTDDILAGTIKFVLVTAKTSMCKSHSDTMKVFLNSAPVVDAGAAQTVCKSNKVKLSGKTTAIGYFWSRGNGTFSDRKILSPEYTPSEAEVAAGSVVLTLNSEATASCPSVQSDVTITFIPDLEVSAGEDVAVCSGEKASLKGRAVNLSLVKWTTTGTGSFLPSDLNDTAVYQPSAKDILAGKVKVALTAGRVNCASVKDSAEISFKPLIRTNAGQDIYSCKKTNGVKLNGKMVTGRTAVWSGGKGTFAPSVTDLTAVYTPSQEEINSGSVSLVLTGTGECPAPGDTVRIIFISDPAADAGENFEICANSNIQLNGKLTNANNGKWTGGQGIFQPNAYVLNATYVPTSYERLTGKVTLALTPVTTGGCSGIADSVTITLNTAPFVYAGENTALIQSGVQLNGKVKNADGGIWKTSGTGTFSPDASTLNAVYKPSEKDLSDKRVILRLTTTGNGNCAAASSDIILLANQVVCKVNTDVIANGNVITFVASNNDNTSVGSYRWDFGNGVTGSGKIQSNVYSKPGKYIASVFYSTPDSSCTASAQDTIVIAATSIPTYKIGGKVTAGGEPLDSGKAVLYKFDGKRYFFMRSQELSVSDTGKYEFSGLKNDYYIVHVIPSRYSQYFTKYQATYYGDSVKWKHSTPVKIDNADFLTADISMKAIQPILPVPGPGRIKGTIVFEDTLAILRVTDASENPVENAVITLYNSNTDRLTSTYTDPYGNYSFEGLEPGSYDVFIEYPGTNQSSTSRIEVGEGTADGSNVALFDNKTNAGSVDLIILKGATVYPNPVSDILTVTLPDGDLAGNAEIRIINSTGMQVFKGKSEGKAGIALNVGKLDQGIYLIEISDGKSFWVSKFNKL